MQDLDWAGKTALKLKPDCFLDLLFGSQRQTGLKEITDPQIIVPELRADKALVIEDGGKTMLKETSIVQNWLTQSKQERWQEGQKEGQKEGKLSLLQIILAQKRGAL